MSSRSTRHLLVTCLVLAGVLLRGLIPAGFMPATGEAARHGALLMVCAHGQMAMHDHGGKAPAGPSLEQCPFGAAAAPSLPGGAPAFHLPPALAYAAPLALIPSGGGEPPHLQPPPRGPPLLS
jgi:hypothetical protein